MKRNLPTFPNGAPMPPYGDVPKLRPELPAILWYLRSDGVVFCCEEGGAMHQQLSRDGSYRRCGQNGELIHE